MVSLIPKRMCKNSNQKNTIRTMRSHQNKPSKDRSKQYLIPRLKNKDNNKTLIIHLPWVIAELIQMDWKSLKSISTIQVMWKTYQWVNLISLRTSLLMTWMILKFINVQSHRNPTKWLTSKLNRNLNQKHNLNNHLPFSIKSQKPNQSPK